MSEKTRQSEPDRERIDNRRVLVINPGHGNEPYILASSIGIKVAEKFAAAGLEMPILVTPLLYGDQQIQILLEENPNQAELLHYDVELGKILKKIMFHSGNFDEHIREVNAHYDEVDQLVNSRYQPEATTIDVRTMTTNKPVKISPKNIIGVIEAGNRVSMLQIPHRFFAFPELLSRILTESIQRPELGFDQSQMGTLAKRMLRTEAKYSKIFVPWINPFSGFYASDLNLQPETIQGLTRTYVPAMKPTIQPTHDQIDPGLYVIQSGTGVSQPEYARLVEVARTAGLKVYSQPWTDSIGGVEKISPNVISNTSLQAVIARAGWGTAWIAMQLEKPLGVFPYQVGDDPEIYFNQLTLEALGMAKRITSGNITVQELTQLMTKVSPGLHDINLMIQQKFQTLNGIEYIAGHIFNNLMS